MNEIISMRSGAVDILLRLITRQILPPQLIGRIKDLSAELKRQALFFDQIHIHSFEWHIKQIRNSSLYQIHSTWLDELELDLEWLRSNRVIVDLDTRLLR